MPMTNRSIDIYYTLEYNTLEYNIKVADRPRLKVIVCLIGDIRMRKKLDSPLSQSAIRRHTNRVVNGEGNPRSDKVNGQDLGKHPHYPSVGAVSNRAYGVQPA